MVKWIGLLAVAVLCLSGAGSAQAHEHHHHHRWHHCHHHFHHHAFNQDRIFYTDLGAYFDIEEDHPDIDDDPVYWFSTQDEEPAYVHHHAYIRRHFHH